MFMTLPFFELRTGLSIGDIGRSNFDPRPKLVVARFCRSRR
jgi:hypothetical protein